MRNTLLSLLLGIAALGTQAGAQTIDATGVWLATDVPYAPWTVKLKQDGTKLTGTMEQNGALRGPVDIYEGKIDGTAISFKVDSPGSGVAIRFTGTLNHDELVLNRSGGNPGGNGLFGAQA